MHDDKDNKVLSKLGRGVNRSQGGGFLVVSLGHNQGVEIGDDIVIMVSKIKNNQVRIAIKADKSLGVKKIGQ